MRIVHSKGKAMSIMLNLALLLIVLITIVIIWNNYAEVFGESLNACEKRGGRCLAQSSCDPDILSEGARIMFEHNGACEETGDVCCKIPEQLQKQKEAIPGTEAITVTLDDRSKIYENTDEIPVYVGLDYTFTVAVDESYDGRECRAYFINGETGQRLSPPVDSTCGSDDFTVSTRFNYTHLDQDVELDVIVYKEGESPPSDGEQRTGTDTWARSAKMEVEVRDPVTITADREWSPSTTVTARCSQCRSASLRIVGETSRCYDTEESLDNFTVQQQQSAGDEYTFSVSGNGSGVACVNATLGTGQEIISLGGADAIVQVDNEPPTFELDKSGLSDTDSPNVIGINCQDGLSGCAEFHYHFFSDADSYGLRRKVQTNSNEALEITIEDIIDGYKSFQGNVQVTPCDNPLMQRSSYRSVSRAAVEIDRQAVDVSDKMYGAVCVYAIDEAGNIGSPQKTTFFNSAYVKEQLLDISIGEILAALGG